MLPVCASSAWAQKSYYRRFAEAYATLLHCPEYGTCSHPKLGSKPDWFWYSFWPYAWWCWRTWIKIDSCWICLDWTSLLRGSRSSWGFRKKSWMEQSLRRFTLLNTFRKNTCVSLVAEPRAILTSGWLLCKSGNTFPLGGLCFIWSSSSSGMMLQAVPLKLNSGSWYWFLLCWFESWEMVPSRSLGPSQQLVSHDPKSNNYYYKYTFLVEICPICLEDLIFLPREVATSLGSLHPLVICTHVSTLRRCFLDAKQYWRAPFRALLSSRQLVEYMVLDVGTVYSEVNAGGSK